MSNYFEAFDIATAAIEQERRTRKNRASTHLAGAALEALEKDGFTLDRARDSSRTTTGETMTHYVLPETDARLDYDKKTKGLYVAVAGPKVLKDFTPASGGEKFTISKTTTVSESPLVNLDYDDGGNLVGVEILLP